MDSFYGLCRKRTLDCSDGHILLGKVFNNLYWNFRPGNMLIESGKQDDLGSVFNLEFSPEGDFVVTVRSGRALVIYDPRQHKRIHCKAHAHDDCVNCITFLSHYLFATCSDDCTVRLWDFRNLHSSLGVLRGHQNWVKNIEYDERSGILFSTAFQDGVRYWDVGKPEAYSDEEERDNLIATLADPVRMRLAPDGSKMFVSSRNSRCFIIDQFDAKKLLDVQDIHKRFLANPQNEVVQEQLTQLTSNRPSLYSLCGLRGAQKYRIVMSVAFHPSGQFVGMRFTDTGSGHLYQELTSLFDIRQDLYTPVVGPHQVQHKYLQYIDEYSLDSVEFIKEVCFSRDGHILASPYKNGLRLLSIDPHCTSPDVYFDDRYQSPHKKDQCPNFEEVTCMPEVHTSPVLTCKFARHDLILASGSLAGTVAFSKPQV